jgi:peptide/nickel transport system substrate-binding protein
MMTTALVSMPAWADVTLRINQVGDLSIVDPIMTTANPTRDMAYMIWDTLFAMDADFKVKPQMVRAYTVSDDKLVYTLTLRDGLKWSDGTPVTSADCIASLSRWMAKDAMGKLLAKRLASMKAVDAGTFTLTLSKPFGMMLDVLGKAGAYVPFMMPERLAKTPATEAIKEFVGSGPFMMKMSEWVPGSKVVYVKNPYYVPRNEPASFLAGGKVAKVDRVERITFPDTISAVNAMLTGDLDYMENMPADLLPLIKGSTEVRTYVRDPLGLNVQIVLNHKIPPTDNIKVRQAIQLSMGQEDFMTSLFGDRKDFYKICPAVFFCGTPLETDVNSARVMTKDPKAAKALLKEAGYDGTPVLYIHDSDVTLSEVIGTVAVQDMRQGGLEVTDFVTDNATKFSRRANSGPVDQGGWNVFWTGWGGLDQMNPLTNVYALGSGKDAWFGWPTSSTLVDLREAYVDAQTQDERFEIAKKMQTEINEIVTVIPMGQFSNPVLESTRLDGMIPGAVSVFWNVSKSK